MASSAKIDLCRPQNGCLNDLPSTSTGIRPVKPELKSELKTENGSDDEKAPTLHRETDLVYDSDSPKKSPLILKPDPDRPSSSTNYSDLHPEEYNNREWNIEKIQYNTSAAYNSVTSRLTDSLSSNLYDPKKQKTGFAYYTRDKEDFKCFSDDNRTFYRIGDYVYLEMDASSPYVIGKIDSFKMKKASSKNTLQVRCTKFFRRDELIADAISLLDSERADSGVVENNFDVKSRELFPSESQVTAQIGCLRGLCTVLDKSVQFMLENGIQGKDTFFYCMSYTSETGRIAMFHPEIRIGKNHQAEIPKCYSTNTNKVKAHEKDREQLLFEPGRVSEETEKLFVENVKNYRRTAAENCPKMNDLEKKAFLGDRAQNDACEVLHRCNYDAREAIKKAMEEDKIYLENKAFMSAEDCKKFVKGLRNYGKNFHKISKEYFGTSFTRDELVHYYYYWKKETDAFKPKNPTRKSIYPPAKRTTRNGTATPTPSDLIDYDSLSEDEEGALHRACHHCYTSDSRDWHHSGTDRQLLCTNCRHHFKKYGSMRHVENKPERPPAALCREQTPTSNEDGEDGGIRTRSTRANRHRTPCDDRLNRNVDSEPERRTTPQRSVKVRKRSYNVSTGSGEDNHSNVNSPRKKDKDVKNKEKKDKDVADLPPVLENEAKRDQELRETSSSRTSSYDGENGTSKKRERLSPPPEPNARDMKDNDVPPEPKPDINENGDIEDDGYVWEPPKNEWNISNQEHTRIKRLVEITDQSQDTCARTQIVLEIFGDTEWQRKRRERAEARAKQQQQKAEEASKAQQAATSQNSLAGLASLANNAGGLVPQMGSLANGIPGLVGLTSQASMGMPPLPIQSIMNNNGTAGGIMQTGQGIVHFPRMPPPEMLQQQFRPGAHLQSPRGPNLNDLILAHHHLQQQRPWPGLGGFQPNYGLMNPAISMGLPMNAAALAANPQLYQQLQQQQAALQQQQQNQRNNQLLEQMMEERKRQEQREREQREREQREREQREREQRERQLQQQQAAQQAAQQQQNQQQELMNQLIMAGMNPQMLLSYQLQQNMLNAHALQQNPLASMASAMPSASQSNQINAQQLEALMRAQQQSMPAGLNPQMAALLAQQTPQRPTSNAQPTPQPAPTPRTSSSGGPLAGLTQMAGLGGIPGLGAQIAAGIPASQPNMAGMQGATPDMQAMLLQLLNRGPNGLGQK
ncbi:unnamed protein product [Bursaphelenchus okinawaensis]|uniref:Egg-laying defective protein 27 n=1 Tax=Bursaphelenchus okinawaensis TaxID=465554 RepID=A0A811KPD4_9BILA|nr:unnamed protein product [Bursaphelenchus okinawaensis]CAG9109980.1 unnamed protein product [Bursaphelenchus okinawaensis]